MQIGYGLGHKLHELHELQTHAWELEIDHQVLVSLFWLHYT